MPEAWWTTYWKSAPASISAASTRGALGLQHEDQLGGDVGQDQGVGVLLVSEWSWLIPVQVERAEPHRSDPQREAEDRSDSRVKDWLGEGQPAGAGGPGQVRFQHGPVFAVGIDAGSLPRGCTGAAR